MIRENQRLLNQLNVLSDGALIALAMLVAWLVRFRLFRGSSAFPARSYVLLTAAAILLCLVTYAVAGLYESRRTVRFEREARDLLLTTVLDSLILLASLYVFRLTEMSRWMLVFFCALAYCLLLAKRAAVRLILRHFRARGYNQKHIILVGDSEMAEAYLRRVREDRELGLLVDGYVAAEDGLPDAERLGGYDDLAALLEERGPDEIVLALSPAEHEQVGRIIGTCEKAGIKLSLIPYYAAYIPANPQVDEVDGLPMINMRRIPLDNVMNAFIKRAFDLVAASLLIVLTSPLMLVAAIGVRLSSPGPVLFRQERIGRDRKPFRMLKFRSMCVNDAEQTGWSRDSDPRKTRFGSFIRKYSIDELPQFFNVLRGEMSLVGPRPEVPHFVEQFREEIPRYMVKHQVRPGITGWAQVNGYRGDTSIRKRIEHDIYYIENWSAFFDLKILLMTLTKIVNSEKLK